VSHTAGPFVFLMLIVYAAGGNFGPAAVVLGSRGQNRHAGL
jgi:hypothetical protein